MGTSKEPPARRDELDLSCSVYGCGYLHDVEYKRTRTFPKGTGISSLKQSLRLQILFPSPVGEAEKGPLPIVVFVPGGSWRTPQVYFRVPFLVDLVRRGFLVAMAGYRGCELFRCEDAVADVRSAVRYMRAHAAEYNGDPDNIFLMGESAGAHLAMLAVCGGPDFDDPEETAAGSVPVRGVLELYGPTDCSGHVTTPEFSALSDKEALTSPLAILARGCLRSEFADRLRPLSPLWHLQQGAVPPPMLLAHGDQDRLVPVWHAERMFEALAGAGCPVEYIRLRNAGHGSWLFYETYMMDRYAQFIRKHAGPAAPGI